MNKLKELREDNDISIEKLLKLLNVSRTTYYNYENELTYPSYKTLFLLADFYKVSIDYLLGYKDNSKKAAIYTSLTTYLKDVNIDEQLTEKEKEIIKIIICSFLKNKNK